MTRFFENELQKTQSALFQKENENQALKEELEQKARSYIIENENLKEKITLASKEIENLKTISEKSCALAARKRRTNGCLAV